MSKSSRLDDFFKKHPDTEEYVVNAEFVMKQLDNALDLHTHDGKNSPLIDQSVTLDFASNGGTIYVRTPMAGFGQGELPNTSGLVEADTYSYTKTVIDNKLAGKSDVGHTHVVSNITDFPTAIKNPMPLIINGQTYDGSSEMSFDIVTNDFVENVSILKNQLDTLKTEILESLETKASEDHKHFANEITVTREDNENVNLQHVLNDYLSYLLELRNSIIDENSRLESLIMSEISRLELKLTEKADKTDTYTKSELDATMADVMKTNADAIMTAQLTAGGAQAVSTSQVRNIYTGTAAMAENASLATGAIYLQYA